MYMKYSITIFSLAVVVIVSFVFVASGGDQGETVDVVPAEELVQQPTDGVTTTSQMVESEEEFSPDVTVPSPTSTDIDNSEPEIQPPVDLVSEPIELAPSKAILLPVPFLSQAPFREWKDPRQQDGCEEASVIMVMRWLKGEKEITKEAGKEEILAISHYTEQTYGEFRDTSAADTVAWIIRGYYNYAGEVEIVDDVTAEDIIGELQAGNSVIIPTNGQALNNPYFTPPGPMIHMLVVIGYDPITEEFITNDPGIGRGGGYRYPVSTIVSAIRDYETGYHHPTDPAEKRMIVVRT